MTGEDLAAAIGNEGDHTSTRSDAPITEAKWAVREVGSEADDLSSLVEQVISRVRDLGPRLVQACHASDATVMLRIIQYASADDAVGAGFALEARVISFLASVNAVLDVDQYVM
jgi:hypothetical protein